MNKFPVEMTHNHNFRLNEREVVKVPMMQTKGAFLAASDQELDCAVLQLEYVGGISMLVVVPHKLSGMKTLESQLTPQAVERWQRSMTNRCLGGWGAGPRSLQGKGYCPPGCWEFNPELLRGQSAPVRNDAAPPHTCPDPAAARCGSGTKTIPSLSREAPGPPSRPWVVRRAVSFGSLAGHAPWLVRAGGTHPSPPRLPGPV